MEDILSRIIQAIQSKRVNVTQHAWQEMGNDGLSLDCILAATCNGRLIEGYPKDFPFPSGLVSGTGESGDPIHAVWALDEENSIAVLVTVYRPDPDRWIDFEKRRN